MEVEASTKSKASPVTESPVAKEGHRRMTRKGVTAAISYMVSAGKSLCLLHCRRLFIVFHFCFYFLVFSLKLLTRFLFLFCFCFILFCFVRGR